MFQIGWMEVNPLSLGCIWLKGVFRECHCSRSRARTGSHFISPVTTAASFHMLWIMWWWKLVQNQDGNHSGTMDKLTTTTTTTTTTKTLIRGAVPKSILHTQQNEQNNYMRHIPDKLDTDQGLGISKVLTHYSILLWQVRASSNPILFLNTHIHARTHTPGNRSTL